MENNNKNYKPTHCFANLNFIWLTHYVSTPPLFFAIPRDFEIEAIPVKVDFRVE
jgi:hypothetical protein